jgi:CRP-like cAMP-binding protein
MPSKPAGLILAPGTPAPPLDGRSSQGSLRWKQELLATVPLFATISKRHLRSIAKIATMSNFAVAEYVVTEGTAGTLFGVVVEGTLRVVKGGRTVARLKTGDFFGEVAVLDPGPRTASLVGETAGRWVRIKGQDLARVMSNEPGVGGEIARVLARRLREASRSRNEVQ